MSRWMGAHRWMCWWSDYVKDGGEAEEQWSRLGGSSSDKLMNKWDRQIGRCPGRYWLVLSTVGHLYPQHLEDGEQILICDMGNGAQNKLTNNSMSVFSGFFFFVVYPLSTLSHTFTTYSHSILTFFREATHINKAKYWSKKRMYCQNKNILYSKGPICSRVSIHSIYTN